MIAQPPSQALLARGGARCTLISSSHAPKLIVPRPSASLRAASVVPQLAAAAPFVQFVPSRATHRRTFSSSAVQDQAIVSEVPTPVASATPLATSGRRRRARQPSDVEKAHLLLKWDWFSPDSPQRLNLAAVRQGQRTPELHSWMREQFEMAKSYRSARARQWMPKHDPAKRNEFVATKIDAYRKELSRWSQTAVGPDGTESVGNRRLRLLDLMDEDEQLDYALRSHWQSMPAESRSRALLKVRYNCIRRLGWRKGYSSGYPRPLSLGEDGEPDPTAHLPDKLGMPGTEGVEALRKLEEREESAAWNAWATMSPAQRLAEEKDAWRLRDRSQVYIDDGESSLVLGARAPRWYHEPERAGQMIFLPNTIVRLVKNHTPPGEQYDPWKATFRVPLNMHKHALRSYLLSIYGLKTTWARSSIYRSPITRDSKGKVISGKGRTWKKVEVGLLEPFLFPEVSPDFKARDLMQSELDYERARVYLKMTKTTRWRSKKPIEDYEQEIKNAEAKTYSGLSVDEAVTAAGAKARSPVPVRFMVRTTGLPSAKHGKILKLLAQKKEEKEKAIEARVAQMKAEAANASSTTPSTAN